MAPMFVKWNRPASFGYMHGSIVFWVVPLGVGKSRFVSTSFAASKAKIPTWIFHSFLNDFLDQ
eukprot:scaffold178533_cov30-Prasinocladus_malaysianus.AAC.1